FENDLNAISVEAMDRLKTYLDVPSHYQFMITNIYAFLLFMNGRYEKARYFAAKAKMANALQKDVYNYSISNVLIALSDRALGRYDLAINGVTKTLSEIEWVKDTPAYSTALMVKAMLLYDRNELDEARTIIENALPNLGIPAITEFLVHGHLILARIEIWEQRYEKAEALLDGLLKKLDSSGYERWSSAITHEQVRAKLFNRGTSDNQDTNGLDRSLNYYNSRYCPAVGHIPLRTHLMVALHQQQHDLATNLLGQLSQVCLLQRDSMLRIVLLSSTAVLEFSRDNREEACEYLNQALHASQRSGITRALFDEVSGFEKLFAYAVENNFIDDDVCEELIANLKQVNFRLVVENKKVNDAESQHSGSTSAQVKPNANLSLDALTQTEQKILILLAQGLPNKSIATQCNINISTVKWHLKNIYSKLYVSNRTEAVIKAQQYQLVAS
ncbi:MAG: LuxR C-terminal-related transcriptional regulator, partial [Pseudomonadales bacterium]|nr:LuxR C-terminal-related transcriptional regulator [Pseudomonadales bacterium]